MPLNIDEYSITHIEEKTLIALADAQNWVACDDLPDSNNAVYNLEKLGLIRVCEEINYALITPKGYKVYLELMKDYACG
jgi:hypothetical protein